MRKKKLMKLEILPGALDSIPPEDREAVRRAIIDQFQKLDLEVPLYVKAGRVLMRAPILLLLTLLSPIVFTVAFFKGVLPMKIEQFKDMYKYILEE